jgi:hypothetical protein
MLGHGGQMGFQIPATANNQTLAAIFHKPMGQETIKEIVDRHLKKWADLQLNRLPIHIETEMADPNQEPSEEWRTWIPIKSKVTDEEIKDFEEHIGHGIPASYKTFLKHKHFYELQLSEVSFCSHPVNIWRRKQADMIFDGYPTEFLIDKGYVPFADWSDWGLLCFDTNRHNGDFNYPIVLWDHEIATEVTDQYADFLDMLVKVDIESIKNSS